MACEGTTLAQVFVLEFSHKLYFYLYFYPHAELFFKYNCNSYGTLAAFLNKSLRINYFGNESFFNQRQEYARNKELSFNDFAKSNT